MGFANLTKGNIRAGSLVSTAAWRSLSSDPHVGTIVADDNLLRSTV